MKAAANGIREPVAIDLFCGAGGLSLGLKQAGFRILSAVDNDPDSNWSYNLNHPEVNLPEEDIRELKGEDLMAGYKGRLTMLAGCPPCQGFTRLNETSEKNDPRNGLILEYMRLVTELKPLVVFFENVPGLLRNGKWYFARLKSALEEEGYLFSDPKVVQLANYGVPQRRRRVIVLCGRGFKLTFPEETYTSRMDAQEERSLKRWKTVRQALKTSRLGHFRNRLRRPRTYVNLLKEGKDPSPVWHVSRSLGEELSERLRCTPASGGSREDSGYELECHAGIDGFHDVYGRLDWNRPSVTITSGCTNLSKGRFGHPEALRALTPREAALLQGFPKSYKFYGRALESICRQIGNALPPLFAWRVGLHVLAQLRAKGLVK